MSPLLSLPRGARITGAAVVSALVLLVVVTVGLFASLNAARTRPDPLATVYASPEALAAAVIGAMEKRDLDGLRSMALTRDEFRAHIWPHLPMSRPEVNMPFDFAWNMLQQNSEGFLRQTAAAVGDVPELRRVEFAGATTRYGDVTVHRQTEIVVASGGDERRIHLMGSMVEQGGKWKVFSYVIDD